MNVFWAITAWVPFILMLVIARREKRIEKEAYYKFGWFKASNAYLSSINHPEFAERVEAFRLGYGPFPLPTLEPPDLDTVEAELKEKYG